MRREGTHKLGFWLQILGLMVFMTGFIFAFQGMDDNLLERVMWIAVLIASLVFVVNFAVSSGMKGAGILYLLLGLIYIGAGIFAISKGYATGSASDCGVYTFKAVSYHQETHTRKVRHRTVKTYTNYVVYQAVLDNGENVTYRRTTSTIGDAMSLVKKKSKQEKQVFAYNGGYYTKEPGTTVRKFLSDFLRWRTILFVSAGIYIVLGVIFLQLEHRISWDKESSNEMDVRTVIR